MFKRILVPIDLAEPQLAKPALEAASSMARASDASVHLLNVMPSMPAMVTEFMPEDFDEQQAKSSTEALAIIGKEAGFDPAHLTTGFRRGGIYHEIIEEAADKNIDLIVMSSHRPAMRTYFLGSNAAHVVRYATCSVLVVRS